MNGRASIGGGVGLRQSPVGSGGSSLSPGDFDSRRRLSAPCNTINQISPTSPVHRASSPSLGRDKMSSDAWVCPNDRQLALRAKLHAGWSVKTASINHWKQPQPLSNCEQEKIVSVIQRAEALEYIEKERLQRLLERLENMRRNAAGDGENTCILCGESFGFFTRHKNLMCVDCKKAVCTKCGVETQGCGKEGTIWLCKICSETREVWKKSGAWFFKQGMPMQDLIGEDLFPTSPEEQHSRERRYTVYKPARKKAPEDAEERDGDEDGSSDEDGSLSKRTFAFNHEKRDSNGSCSLSLQSNFSSMDSLYCPETDLYRRSEPGSGSRPNLPALPLRGSPGRRPPPSRGSPLHFRPRPPVPRMNRPPGPPWTHRPPFPSPRGPRPPPLGSPRGSPRGMTRGRHPGGRRPPSSRPVSCPPSRPESSGSQTPPPLEDREVTPGKESSSPSDSDLTEVPLSLSLDGKPRHRGSADGVISTLRRLSTVNRKSRSKRRIQDFGLELQEEGAEKGSSSRKEKDVKSQGSDDGTSMSPRTPEGSSGLLEFALIYDETASLLLVNILRAKGLKGLDVNGLCDSYCRVTLVPPSKKVTQQRTKTVMKSIHPEYTSLLNFPDIPRDQLSTMHMLMHILDEDISGDHLLAEARVGLIKIFPQMQKQFQVCLHRPVFQDGSDSILVASDCGQLDLSVAFYSQHGTLKVSIISCKGLSPLDAQVNPYVRVTLLPENNGDNKRKTTMKWKTPDPEYNEQFVYLTNITDLPKQSLSVTIWSYNKDVPEDYLGGLVLGLGCKGERLKHWASVIKHPNKVHKKTHTLSSNFLG